MHYLHFNEKTQKFLIIQSGSTISPQRDGEDVLSSITAEKLQVVAITAGVIAQHFNLKYTIDGLKSMFNDMPAPIPEKSAE